MKYIVYKTTNKINGKIYVGVHKTEDPEIFDGYIGCGVYVNQPSTYLNRNYHLHNAIRKYGISAFCRDTIKIFDNLEDALDFEAYIVDKNFVNRCDTYNMTVGGQIPPICTKTIYEFDIKGVFIKTWNSITSIIETFGCNKDRIWMVIKEKRSFNNSYWSTFPKIDISEYRVSSRGYIFQYNKKGELINFFENASIASIKLGIKRNTIVSSIYDRTLCNGYYFLKSDEDINEFLHEKSNKQFINITPVYRYLKSGEFDCEFKSIKEAVENTKGACHSNIIRAIKNNKTCGGFKWSYIKSNTIQLFKQDSIKSIKIAQYDKNRNLIKIWDSIVECKKEFPSCQKVCRKERKTSKGFIFEYIS